MRKREETAMTNEIFLEMKEKGAHILEVRKGKTVLYPIVFADSFGELPAFLEEAGFANRKICVVTDSNTEGLFGKEVCALLQSISSHVTTFTFPAGEENKNLDTVRSLYEHLILEHFDRKDVLLALGGGVVGDLTGYAAATYLRGIDFVQVPTTLLSQVDSSIGGKTGVDFDSYKNMVGAFHMPRLVYMNLNTLKELPESQFRSGMGEILKHGLIKDAAYYEWLISNLFEIEERDFDILFQMIKRSCEIKRMVVEKDPTEKGDRALLNFGHTIGHAVEKLKDFQLLHGECVAIGTVAAAYISLQRGLLSHEEFFEIRDMTLAFGLPIRFDGLKSQDVLAATKADKKMDAGAIRFILLKKIGKAYVDATVTDEELLQAIDYINRDLEEQSNE